MCKIRSICYGSTFYFVDQFKKAMEEYGCQVDVFDSETTPLEKLSDYEGKNYDAVIDFNSILPSIETDTNDYFLNTIDAPFYNYMLDHPIYHHDMLKKQLRNYNVICLDEFHRNYILSNYPHIKSVLMMPLGTDLPDTDLLPIRKRKYDILFTGTYTDPERAASLIKNMGTLLSSEMFELADIIKSNPSLTIEDAAQFLINNGLVYSNYSEHMKIYFLVDTYIKAYFRMLLLDNIASSGFQMTIAGEGWEKSSLNQYSNVTLIKPLSFEKSIIEMGNSKIVINSMPWFKGGLHDRVISSMSRRAIAFSDSSTYINHNFTDKKDIVTFSPEKISQCPDILYNLFENPQLMESIAENGWVNVSLNHLWKNRAACFIHHLSSSCNK